MKIKGIFTPNPCYVKLNDSTQKDLETLSKFGAFQQDKKFKKSELLPLLTATTKVFGTEIESKSFIDKVKELEQFNNMDPGDSFKGDLRDWPTIGMSWINFLYTNQFGGVLADDMGLENSTDHCLFNTN